MPRMWYISGVERTTGMPLSLIWCGPRKQQEYMISRIFGENEPGRKCVGRRPVMMLKWLQKSYNCSLGIVAGPQSILACFCRDDDICVPWWVNAELDIDKALDCAGRPRSLKDDLRRIRKFELGYEVVTDLPSYKRFYENFYIPTVTASHGAATLTSSYEKRCAEVTSGKAEILFITMDREAIGAVLISYANDIPTLRDVGILEGSRELLKTGVITATYYFAMQHLRQHNFRRVCMGLSRSFLNDGVLTFKQKWQPTLIESSQESFLIRVSRLCTASRAFLRSSSYITEQEGDFHFAFFAANDDDIQSNRFQLGRLSAIYGIDSCSNIDLSGQRPIMRRAS